MLDLLKDEEIDFELTVLALREAIMQYFKEYIGNKYVHNDSIGLRQVEARGARWSDRRENQIQATTEIYVASLKIATMRKSPDTITLHKVDDERLVRLNDAMVETVQLYLPNVVLERS